MLRSHLLKSPPESRQGNELTEEAFAEIQKDFERTLVLPAEKRSPQIFLCPVGLIGSGKTTVITPLAQKLSLLRVSNDEIRKMLKERGYNYTRTREMAVRVIEKYARAGWSIAVDSDCASPEVRARIEELSREFGVKILWVHVNPPEEWILNKLRVYPHTWLFKDADQAVENYFMRKYLHEHLDMPFAYTFDPSHADLERQIDETARLIESMP